MNEYNESPMRFWLSNANNDQLNWRQIASDQYTSIEMNFSLLNHLLLTVNDGNGTYLKECKSSRLPRPLLWNHPVTSLRFKLRNWENNQIGAVVWLGDWNALKRHQLCNEKKSQLYSHKRGKHSLKRRLAYQNYFYSRFNLIQFLHFMFPKNFYIAFSNMT